MKIKCLIVDDEHPALKLLEEYIANIPELELVGKCEDALQANSYIRNSQVDILFLDIQMPNLTGVEFLNTLNKKPLVIFTTAYPEYALEGFDLAAVDYLLKPFSFERFLQACNKAIDRISLKNSNTTEGKNYFFVKADYKKIKVRYDDILYIEGLREYVSIFTKQKRIVFLEALKNLETTLPKNFIRVHKSYIIPIPKVDAIIGNSLEINGKKIPIGKSYSERVLKIING